MAVEIGVEALREEVALSCRIIGNRGVTKGSFGHVSARIPGTDRILIKAKGPNEEALEFATEKDIITITIIDDTLGEAFMRSMGDKGESAGWRYEKKLLGE